MVADAVAQNNAARDREVADLRAEVRSGNGRPRESRRDEVAGRGENTGMPAGSLGSIYKASKPGDMVPPTFAESKLHEKSVLSYLKAMGDETTWDESRSDAKPEHAMQWFECKIEYAQVANLDACTFIRTHLSRSSQQWLSNLLATNTFHHWASDNYASLRMEFRKRFAMQVRSDASLAKERLVNKGLYQDGLTLEKYAEAFMHQLRLIGDDAMCDTIQCSYFVKGLERTLKVKCLTDRDGEEWSDLQALIKYAGVQSRQLQAQGFSGGQKRPSYSAGAGSYKAHKRDAKSNPAASAAFDARHDHQGGSNRSGGYHGGAGGSGGRGGGASRPPYGGGGGGAWEQRSPPPTNLNTPPARCPAHLATGRLTDEQCAPLKDYGLCFRCRGANHPHSGRHRPWDCDPKKPVQPADQRR
jgi:hypothetical protein